ncbi:O-antigen polymerase [Pseudomonas sp. UM16]|uniref:O-antigen polymerase n=1 Tax=Pseudomonas sp. UM16 TaxID=3158962 RepID=UPI00398FAF0E
MGAILIYPIFITFLLGLSFPLSYYFDLNLVTVDVFLLFLLHLLGYLIGGLFLWFSLHSLKKSRGMSVGVPLRYSIHLSLFVGILFIIYAYYQMGGVPALAENAENARVEMKQGVGKYIIFGVGFIYVSMSYLSSMFFARGGYARWVLLPIVWFVVSLLLMGIGYRSLFFFLLVHVALFSLICREKFNFRSLVNGKLLVGGAVLFLLMSLVGYARYKSGAEGFGMLSLFWPLIVYGGNIESVFELVGKQGFSYGSSFISDMISPIFGDGKFTGHQIKEILGLKFDGEGVSITIIGEAYLNFGLTGVFLSGFLIGAIILFVSRFVFSHGYLYRMFFVIVVVFVIRIITSGVAPIFWFYFIPVVTAYLFVLSGALLEKKLIMK